MVSMGKRLGYIWLAWERRRKDYSQADISGYIYSHALGNNDDKEESHDHKEEAVT